MGVEAMATGDLYAIWGSAGHAKVLAELIEREGGRVSAFFDNRPEARSVREDVPLFVGEEGFLRWVEGVRATSHHGLVAIGGDRGADRLRIQALFRRHGLSLPSVVHRDASVSPSARLGSGTQVLAQAVVAADAVLGEACIVNHRSAVDHECVIGHGVHLAPGVTLCGCVEIGDEAFIAAGSTVLPRVRIGRRTIVGAGSVVTRDLPEGVVAYGSPARVIRAR